MPRVRNKAIQLKQNAASIWEIHWSEDGRSKRVSTRATDRTEAEAVMAGWMSARTQPRAIAPSDEPLVNDIINWYLDEHVESGDVVAKFRQRSICASLKLYFGPMRPRDIAQTHTKEYCDLRRKGEFCNRTDGRWHRKVNSSGTLRRELNVLVAALSHATERTAISRRLDPRDVPYIHLPASPPPKDLWFDEKETEQLIAASYKGSIRGCLFVLLALNTASRKTAIEQLQWGQVDLDARRITLNPGGKNQSNKRRPVVPINDELHNALMQVWEQRDPKNPYVLNHPGSCRRALEVVFRHAFEATQNPKFLKASAHTLRHTWATCAARAGEDMWKIAGMLGDSLATVTKTYTHHCPEHLMDVANFRQRSLSGRGVVSAPMGARPGIYAQLGTRIDQTRPTTPR